MDICLCPSDNLDRGKRKNTKKVSENCGCFESSNIKMLVVTIAICFLKKGHLLRLRIHCNNRKFTQYYCSFEYVP